VGLEGPVSDSASKPTPESTAASRSGWDAFQSVLQTTADKAGGSFLRQLVRELAHALGVSHAFVAEFAGSRERVRTLGFWGDSDWLDDVEYDVRDTPCREVIRSGFHLCPDDVQALYPADEALRVLNLRSYAGIALGAESGAVGHLAVLDRKPLDGNERWLSLLRLFANRARIELERIQAEQQIEATLGDLRSKLADQSLAMASSSRELQFAHQELAALLRMNQAVSRGLERDDLFGALAGSLSSLLPTDRFGIEMPHEGDKLRGHLLQPVDGRLPNRTDAHILPAAGTACAWVIENGERWISASREEIRTRFPKTFEVMTRERVESLCVLPLGTGAEARAALFFMAEKERAYDDVRSGLLDELGGAVAVALDNSLAHEELSSLRDQLAAENQYLREEIRHDHNFAEIVGRSEALGRRLREVEQVAPTQATVLILGESGTGKELVARAIHARSPRAGRPLIKVNCAAIPEGLVESELFGHEKGAFTGAAQKRIGRFELAEGGTIFLDEIGELPLAAQVKLLRVLQEREFEPVGSSRTCKVDVRVLAATNRDLRKAIGEGRFREDLYYRLNVFPLELPPLRERLEDVPLLAELFLERAASRVGRRVAKLSREAAQRLVGYAWPGNVRELENVVERAVILCPEGQPELPFEVIESVLPASSSAAPEPVPERPSARATASETLEGIQRGHIEDVLRACRGRIEGSGGAARALGLKPSTLRSLMKRLGVERPPGGAPAN